MDKKINFIINTERENNVEGGFLTYRVEAGNELTLEGSPAGLSLLAEKLLAAAGEEKTEALAFEDHTPVSRSYKEGKEREAADFIKKLPHREAGKSYILTFTKDGKVRDLVVTAKVPGEVYEVIFEDHFTKYFLRHEEGRYVYVLSKSPSKREISRRGVEEAVRFFLHNEGDGAGGLSWKEGTVAG